MNPFTEAEFLEFQEVCPSITRLELAQLWLLVRGQGDRYHLSDVVDALRAGKECVSLTSVPNTTD